MTDDPITPPPLAPELNDLLTTTERDVLRAIVRDGDIVDGFKARLLSGAHGLAADDDGDAKAWLLVPLSPAMIDALAAFEADEADLEDEPDLEDSGDAEPSLGATNDKNQDKAWRGTPGAGGVDLEFDGDTVPDADLEPNLGATNCGNPIIPQTFWALYAPEECEKENEHGEGGAQGDGSVDYEPSLGATEDIDHRKAWKRLDQWTFCEDGEAQGTEDDLMRPDRTIGEENAKRAAVQEAVGRLSEITGMRAYGGAHGRVRFYTPEEMQTVGNVRIVGVLR